MTKRKDGRWQEEVLINGKRKFFYGKTKSEVLRKINEFKEREKAGKLFSTAACEWEAEHREEVSYNAHRAYNVPYAESVKEFGHMYINDITAQDIDLFIRRISAMGYAKRTVKGYLSVLSLIFNFAMRKGYCNNNPTIAISVPAKLKTTKRDLPTSVDIDVVKRAVNNSFGLFAYFLLYTGCRRGEALAITMDDIDFENNIIFINKSLYWESNTPVIKSTKTNAGNRTIILLDALKSKLPKDKEGYLFGNEKPMTLTAFRYHWGKYVKETGITLTPHQLRHLFATILYECGIDEKITQELMGHSNISITRNIYTHIREQKINETANILNQKITV